MSARDMVVSKKIFLALTADVKKEIKLTDEQDRKMKDLFGDSLRDWLDPKIKL